MSSFVTHPAVFCVGKEYQIVFLTDKTGMAWIEAGGKRYNDCLNGIMRWDDQVHRITLPQEALAGGEYTVYFQGMENRAAYHAQHDETESATYHFQPLTGQLPLRVCMIADTHGRLEEAVAVAALQPFDLLVMAGDIANHNTTREDLWLLLKQCSQAAKGEKPVICVRGNHDTRGPMATYLPQMIGTDGGNTYFIVELPGLFCTVLDVGEDKLDSHPEYGGTVCFEPYREEEQRWLEKAYADGAWKNTTLNLALCHVPFTRKMEAPFDIEEERYDYWVELLGKMGTELMLCGHTHEKRVYQPDHPMHRKPPAFPVVISSEPRKPSGYDSLHMCITQEAFELRWYSDQGELVKAEDLPRK